MCFEPAEDGMGWLSLFLEAERGIAIMAHLDALADAQQRADAAGRAPASGPGPGSASDSASGASDSRTRAQLSLDLAADLLLGRATTDAPPLGVVTPKIYVTVPALTLLGHTDQPAELDGHGPIDDDTARRLAAHAPSFHRILTHPETGAYLSYGRTSYRVPADLAGYLRIRDGSCRFPGCSRRAHRADLDHTTDWATGGPTRHDNLAHLCRKHHRLKHHTNWKMTQTPGGDIRWTSPAGREHHTTPTHPFAPISGSQVNAERSAPPSPPADARQPASETASTSATNSAPAGAPSASANEIEPPWATAA
ncbi:hypothetical protein QFZ29_003088 [Agromyces albus]|nr:hypothetical protein [Agromyces albus]